MPRSRDRTFLGRTIPVTGWWVDPNAGSGVEDFMITSLHHVTATVGNARADRAFHAGTLGLRLLKRTINFDNPSVYHLYYGTEVGAPSTIMTTFPYEGWGMKKGRPGSGQITEVWYSVPPGSLGTWSGWLDARGTPARTEATPFGEPALQLSDPSGLDVRLVEAAWDPRSPWNGGGPGEGAAIRGVHHVTIRVRRPDRSLEFLTKVLGLEVIGEGENRTRVAVGASDRATAGGSSVAGAPGAIVEVEHVPEATAGAGGIGTVHHLAFSVPGDEEQAAFQERLRSVGWPVTEVRDRQYFRSIYFPEPGGALFEIATAGPGFAIDEPLEELGGALKLPSWEEPNRASIEPHLPALESA